MSINDKVLVKKDFVIHWIIVLDIFSTIVIFVGANICYNNLLKDIIVILCIPNRIVPMLYGFIFYINLKHNNYNIG